jgi:serine/threonine protein kinase/Flp pilus assembly protein TadD
MRLASGTTGPAPSVAEDLIMVQWIEDVKAQFEAGVPVDLDGYLRQDPARAERLRRLVPTIELMAELGRSSAPEDSRSFVAEASSIKGAGSLGDYWIGPEIGRGGMGVVYEAEQISLHRRVALKVLPFASALDPKQLRRFQNESLAAAHLHHPHIVPVHAVGCERGVHYYAMQYIDGQPLSALIEELRRIEGRAEANPPEAEEGASPSTGVARSSLTSSSTRSRAFFHAVARLGSQAAEALEHAHEQGVLHRDIKPSNLLVDGRGRLWITDFGLARLQGDAGLTMTGDLLGTLRYMSPEQALARPVGIDHRTDIYSLGATLYELLTLEPAYAGRDRQEVLRRIAFEEPRPPRRLNPAIPVDLETIVLKAMAKELAGRYAMAQELAEDLNRYLNDQLIRASRPTRWQRLSRWARRHQPLVWSTGISAVLMMMMAVTALSVSNVLIRREKTEKDRALEAARSSAATTQAQEQLAEQRLSKACEAVDLLLTRVAQERLLDKPQMESLRRVLLEDAARFYQVLVDQEGTNRNVRYQAGRAYRALASLQVQLSEVEQARTSTQQAIRLFEQLRAEDPTDRSYRFELSMTYWQLGGVSLGQGWAGEAAKSYRDAIALATEVAAEAPDESVYRLHLASSLCELGSTLLASRDFRQAEEAYRQALTTLENLPPGSEPSSGRRKALAYGHNQLGVILGKTGRYREAEKNQRVALDLARTLVAVPDPAMADSHMVMSILMALGDVLQSTGRLSEARDAFRQALTLAEKLAVDFPRFPSLHSSFDYTLTQLNRLLEAASTPREVEEFYHRNVAALKRRVAELPHIPLYRIHLSKLHLSRARSFHWTRKEAEDACRRALSSAEDLATQFTELPTCRDLVVDCRLQLALILVKRDRLEEAERICRPTLPLVERLAVEFPADVSIKVQLATAYGIWGQVLKESHRPREAEAAFRKAAASAEKRASDHPENPDHRVHVAFAYSELALLLARDPGRRHEAEDAHRRELALLSQSAKDSPHRPDYREQLAHSHRLWGFLLKDQGRHPEAEASFREAVEILEKSATDFPSAAPVHRRLLGDTLANVASLLATMGRPREATETLGRALEFPPSGDDPLGCNNLAWILVSWPDPGTVDQRRAVELASKAVKVAPDSANYWNTLGVAHYRAGNWTAATEALTTSMELTKGGDNVDWLFLAMAHWQRGDKPQALTWYDKAVASIEKNQLKNQELIRLRDEAQRLLGGPARPASVGAETAPEKK